MNTKKYSGLAALGETIKAYEELKDSVKDIDKLQEQTNILVEELFASNDTLSNIEPYEHVDLNGYYFGDVRLPMSSSDQINNTLRQHISSLQDRSAVIAPIVLDFSKPFSLFIEADEDVKAASIMAQRLLIAMLKQNSSVHFRCADFLQNGNLFSETYGLVHQMRDRSSGVVLSKASQMDDLLQLLEKHAAKSMSESTSLTGDYKKENNMISVLFLKEPEYNRTEMNRLLSLVSNGKRTGLSFVLVGGKPVYESMKNAVEYNIRIDKGGTFINGYGNALRFIENKDNTVFSSIDHIVEQSKKANYIDTVISNPHVINDKCNEMDSTEVLRIPFAYDKSNNLQYFEIGGEAPSHALISGSTGSGKSVALHTLIMQIAYNYHPDDVEIWAIDYKAVEFDSYIDHKTPHFRVIAHDTSTEFSLSLLDLLNDEYNKRMKLFLEAGVKNISEYRYKYGKHSMARIVVFIDEFQLLTQAVQTYTGNTDYRTILENLLRLTRAMGISFVLCSQTIASGLSGLTDSARDQIGVRLSLKHEDDNEIRETLMLWGAENAEVASRAKDLRRGEGIYRRMRFANENSADGKPYEFKNVHILYLTNEAKDAMIEEVNAKIGTDFTHKDEIFVRGGGRIPVFEKVRHDLNLFLAGQMDDFEDDSIDWYPAAPTSLADQYKIQVDNSAGTNMLLVGENDPLRDSILFHSVCGFLMNPQNTVIANFLDPEYSDRRRIIDILKKIHSERLIINEGAASVVDVIHQLKRIKPLHGKNYIYLWYGLEKLKNELFLLKQDAEERSEQAIVDEQISDREKMLDDLMGFLAELNGKREGSDNLAVSISPDEIPSIDDCTKILRQVFEVGTENGYYSLAVFNNYKSLKKSNMIALDCFENRIGTRMSMDDSFELFGSSLAVNKTDETTVIYYPGGGNVIPLRPYLMPDDDWIEKYNYALNR